MRITAVVLNWRRPTDTIRCVRSLTDSEPDAGVIVVDNASGDGSADMLRAELPGIPLVENDANEGYAGGNNAGIERALAGGADAVFVLNNDAVVEPGCLRILREGLATHGDWGIVAPLSVLASDPGVVDFYRATVDLPNMAVQAHGRDKREIPTEEAETDYATGSALLIRREVLERVGAFDPRYFLVWEDVDLSLRVRGAGFGLGVLPQARVLHARSSSIGEASVLYQYFYARNSFLIVRDHLKGWHRFRTRRLIERRYRGWSAIARDPDVGFALARGLQDGVAGRFGPPPADVLSRAGAA